MSQLNDYSFKVAESIQSLKSELPKEKYDKLGLAHNLSFRIVDIDEFNDVNDINTNPILLSDLYNAEFLEIVENIKMSILQEYGT